LKRNSNQTSVYHILTADYQALFQTMELFLNDHVVPETFQTLQSFAIPNTELDLEIFVAPKSDLDTVRDSVYQVLAQNQTYVYYLEVVIRGPNPLSKNQVGALLPQTMNSDLVFIANYSTADWDNRLNLFTVPALVANGAWYARHPWGSYFFPSTSTGVFKTMLDSLDPFTDLGFGLIAIYPYAAAAFSTNSFLSVPHSTKYFYHVTLGKTDLVNTTASLASMAQGNRNLWNALVNAGDGHIYPTIYIPDFGPDDWMDHFGSKWENFQHAKRDFDPAFILADERNFGFDY